MRRHFRVSETDCLKIASAEHRLVSFNRDGSVWARLDDSSVRLSFSGREFLELLARPDVNFMRGKFSNEAAFRRHRCDVNYLNSLSSEKRARVLWQSTCARLFLEAEAHGEVNRSEKSVEKFMPTLEARVNSAEESGQHIGQSKRAGRVFERRSLPSSRWLMHWVRMYESGGQSPLVFLRKRRSDCSPRKLHSESERVLAECVAGYLDRNEPTQEQIVISVRDRFAEINAGRIALGSPLLPVPSSRTVRRRIKSLDPFEVVAQRKGLEAARRKFSFYEEGIRADYPLQRVEMDEWQIDICSLLDESGALDGLSVEDRAKFEVGRRWIYVALDCATRCIVSFRLVSGPNYDDAIRALSLISEDKTSIAEAAGCASTWSQFGGVSILVTDQGSAFAAVKFRASVADLGATYEAPPAGVPKLRARIERVFRTFGLQLAPMLIGRTFGNTVERGDYPSEKWAALTDEELAQVLTLFIVDVYHNSPHSGLQGETPANAWKRLSEEQGVTPPPDANHRRAVFGIPLYRKLDRHGVRVFGINYTCPELQQALLRGATGVIPIHVDPEDLTHVSVCIGHQWFSAEATARSVWGLKLADWLDITRELRARFREEATLSEQIVREARKKIRAIDARARQLRRVQPRQFSAESLDREERQLFTGLRIGPTDSAATGDLEQLGNAGQASSHDLFGDVIAPHEPAGRSEADAGSLDREERELPDDGDDWIFDV